MADDVRPFQLYKVSMISGVSEPYRARIPLWGEVAPSVYAKVAELYFMRENVAANPPDVDDDGAIRLFFPSSSMVAVLDILRNEKPLRIRYDPDGPAAAIEMIIEPVGEQET